MFIIEVIVTDELAVTKHLPFVPCPMATVQQIVFNVFDFVDNVGLRYRMGSYSILRLILQFLEFPDSKHRHYQDLH